MGWRPGQGIGPRQTRKEKKMARARNQRETYVMQQYGYQPNPKTAVNSDEGGDETESSDEDPKKLHLPQMITTHMCYSKKRSFWSRLPKQLKSRSHSFECTFSNNKQWTHYLFEPALEAMGKNIKDII
ncbi:unnamed protein product [Ceratitis capitata]|uniref:(Mediterranean fruit fly) hypothetical protein n=1 Tax=Ceratitis capitata TaxID=7213 RepID=A0A811V6M0_CERCA|nr:unnamed protein product [Ceratitis capitata]